MSSTMTPGFRTFSLFALAGAAVLVLHTAAHAQQKKPGPKAVDKPKAEVQAVDQSEAEAEPAEQPKAEVQAAAPSAAEAKDAELAKPEVAAEPGAQPAAPAEDLPPEYAPPPGYRRRAAPPEPGYPPHGYGPHYDYYYGPPPYPPPRYYRQRPYHRAPVRYYPEPISYRTFFFGLGLGIGGVAFFPDKDMGGENSSRAGMAYNLHFGFGVSPHWSIVLSGDGAFAYFNGYDLSQSVWSIGPQVFINRHLYVRAGLGVATKSVDNSASWDYYGIYESYSDSGMGCTLALGYEFLQSYHTSLGLEMGATFGRYKDLDPITYSRNQGTFGINFMLNLF